jgi:hypothetical protein
LGTVYSKLKQSVQAIEAFVRLTVK